ELYEAASIDGAGSWDRFRHVTVPLLRPVLAFVSVILTIGAFGTFLPNYIMTGPEHSTESLLTYGYTNAFSSFDFGYGAAITYLFATFIMVVTLLQLRFVRTKVEY
ncbi:MAG: binding-protein-dependent transport system inner rane component, partial [Chloroflexi bacterium]|nr:binding-protein-dependent transport system inner rane component [Chloroflexota bacterium]